jgi:hypothetical protein
MKDFFQRQFSSLLILAVMLAASISIGTPVRGQSRAQFVPLEIDDPAFETAWISLPVFRSDQKVTQSNDPADIIYAFGETLDFGAVFEIETTRTWKASNAVDRLYVDTGTNQVVEEWLGGERRWSYDPGLVYAVDGYQTYISPTGPQTLLVKDGVLASYGCIYPNQRSTPPQGDWPRK